MINSLDNTFFNFKKKIVLITGSNGIIGKEVCNLYLNLGAIVFGIDQKKSSIKNANYTHFVGNICDEVFIIKKLKEILNKKSRIDIILNCAAVSLFTHFEKRTKKEIYKTLDVNIVGTLNVIKNYAKIHKNRKLKNCRIVNFGSIYGINSPDFRIYGKSDRFNSEIYGASKASIIQLTKYLGVMYIKNNIFINCISPGGTISHKNKISKKFYKKYSKRTPINRMATPKDLFTSIIYLTNSETKYTVGQNIVVDGGLSVW